MREGGRERGGESLFIEVSRNIFCETPVDGGSHCASCPV